MERCRLLLSVYSNRFAITYFVVMDLVYLFDVILDFIYRPCYATFVGLGLTPTLRTHQRQTPTAALA